jgi:hypothetical protein
MAPFLHVLANALQATHAKRPATFSIAGRVSCLVAWGSTSRSLRDQKNKPQDQTPKSQLLQELLHENLTNKTSSNTRQTARKRAGGYG